MRRILMLATAAAAAALAGCYTVDQARLRTFVNQTVEPGMPLDQAMTRMSTEGFQCDVKNGAALVVCSRPQKRAMQGDCLERVTLTRDLDKKTLTAVDVVPIWCAPTRLFGTTVQPAPDPK